MPANVRAALENIKRGFPALANRKLEWARFVWYEGWNDGVNPNRAIPKYEQNPLNFIKDVRKDLKAKKLPFVILELPGPGSTHRSRGRPIAAIRNKPRIVGSFRGMCSSSARDFVRPAKASLNPDHGQHEFGNAETYVLVGEALSQRMLTLLAIVRK